MNKVMLIGRLTADPEVRYMQRENSMCVARYTLAVDRRVKAQNGQQNADFIRCVAFGKSGEFAEKYLHKGIKIGISGKIQTGSYKDRDGKTVFTTDIVIEEQEFSNNGGQPQGNYQQQTMDGFMSIPDGIDEELPFH